MKSNKWSSKENEVNFRLKEWRQDLAYYIQKKFCANELFVSKAYKVKNSEALCFNIYNDSNNFNISFLNKNEIVHADSTSIWDYLKDKGVSHE